MVGRTRVGGGSVFAPLRHFHLASLIYALRGLISSLGYVIGY